MDGIHAQTAPQNGGKATTAVTRYRAAPNRVPASESKWGADIGKRATMPPAAR